MFGNVGQPPKEGKKSGAGNEISYNDITFPPTQTLKRRGEEESGRCWGSRTPPQKWAQGRDFKEKKKK